MAVISLATLYFSHSATSLLALVVGGSLSLYFFLSIRFELGFFRMALMAIFFVAVIGLAIANIDTAELLGRSGDLTGRGEVWAQTWKLILEKPLTGYGYGSIWNPNDATIWIQQSLTDFSWVVYHAHNGFLQIASEIGLPLSSIALLMVVQQLIEIFYCQYQRQQTGVLFVLGFVVAYLVSNYSEARFLVNRELYWILFLTLPISMLRQVNVVLSDPADLPENTVTPHRPQHRDATGHFSAAAPGASATAGAVALDQPEFSPVNPAADKGISPEIHLRDVTGPSAIAAPSNTTDKTTDFPSSEEEPDYNLFDHFDEEDRFDKDFGVDISLDENNIDEKLLPDHQSAKKSDNKKRR